MGQIIGLTGAIGSGKTTLKDALIQLEPDHVAYETSTLIAELGDDFNHALHGELAFETTSSDIELVNQSLIWFIEAITEKLHRDVTWNQLAITKQQLHASPELFEKLSLYLRAVKPDPQLLEARITAQNKETYRPLLQWLGAYLIAKVGPTVWYDELFRRIDLHDSDKKLVIIGGVRYPSDAAVVRNHGGLVVGIERPVAERDGGDPTEVHRGEIQPDISVINNGSVAELSEAAVQLWQDLAISKHAAVYRAAS